MIWVVNAKEFNIDTFSLDLARSNVEKIEKQYLTDRLNSFFKVPSHVGDKLLQKRNEILKGKWIRELQIKELVNLFEQEFALLIQQYEAGASKVIGIDPNEFRRKLLQPIFSSSKKGD